LAAVVLVATWAEALPLLDRRPQVTGMGRRTYRLDGCRAVLSAGFAGACQAGLQPGEVLLAGEAAPWLRGELGASEGELQTLSHIASVHEKAELGRLGVAAVDMETEHLAKAAAERGIPFLGVRVIIDRVQDPALSLRTAMHYPAAAARLRTAVIHALQVWPAALEPAQAR
jgi:nucleoside phosphorylase